MILKVEIARRQLGTALAMFLDDADPVAIHCLAGGGCEVIEYYAEKAGGKPFISHMLNANPRFDKNKLHHLQREYWNAFKHSLKAGTERQDDDRLARFTDEQNDHALFIGWYDYAQATKKMPVEAQAHQAWYFAKYPEKLHPAVASEQYDKMFPNLRKLPRAKQKLRLRTQIKKARADVDIMRDERTEARPLILGWPPR